MLNRERCLNTSLPFSEGIFYRRTEASTPILAPDVEAQILNDIQSVCTASKIPEGLLEIILVGSLLYNNPPSDAKAEVIIGAHQVLNHLDDFQKEQMLRMVNIINHRNNGLGRTTYGVKYTITTKQITPTTFQRAYLIRTQDFIGRDLCEQVENDLTSIETKKKKIPFAKGTKILVKHGLRKISKEN